MGAKVWGAVAEVGTKDLVVSLPHGLKGHVTAADVSAPATSQTLVTPASAL